MISNDDFPLFQDIPFDFALIDDLPDSMEDYFTEIDVDLLLHSSSASSLTLINPPEPIYHVRYLSEMIPTTMKRKSKSLSARYLRGCRGRHVTVQLPSLPLDAENLYIRVTRLTVPFDNQSFIHPYPLVYCNPKKKQEEDIIIQEASIYYRLNKEEICSALKQFPHIILTRLKQCHLKQLTHLQSFDQPGYHHAFETTHVKRRIALYQLKQSQLDFRLMIKSEHTGEFLDMGIYCRSSPLLEKEGIGYKRSTKEE